MRCGRTDQLDAYQGRMEETCKRIPNKIDNVRMCMYVYMRIYMCMYVFVYVCMCICVLCVLGSRERDDI